VEVALRQQNLGALQSRLQAAVDADSERRLIFWEPPASGKHGVFLSRFSYNPDTERHFTAGGLGLTMKGKLGRTVVTAVEPGSPAALQCPTLEPGMVLVAVDAAPIGPAGGKINRADPDFGPALPASTSRES
jgi:predicted metalloprotease with PDZ domain